MTANTDLEPNAFSSSSEAAPGLTAADFLVDLLISRWGVRHIFGYPGDGINGVIEALRRRRDEIQFIQVRHEEAAAFAACGYAKFSGKLGVCLATSGPGAIHLINGLYDAKADQAPVLAITGLQYSDVTATHFQQDFDTVRLIGEVAPFSERIMQPAHVENMVNLAVRSALSYRGVSHLGIPIDVQEAAAASGHFAEEDQPRHTSADYTIPLVSPQQIDLERAAAVLNAGSKTFIMVGAGARGARAEIEQLAETLGAPVGKALLGKEVLPDDSPYTTGGVAIIGTAPSQQMMRTCDTLLLIGTSMPYTAYYPKVGSARGVQIDIDPARIGLRYPVEVGLTGNTRETLLALLPLLKRNVDRSYLQGAQEAMEKWRDLMESQEQSKDVPMRPQVFIGSISKHLKDDAIICADVGQVTHWSSRHINIRGDQKFSCSGTLASMANALPYAIGAQVAFPDRQVIAYAGDGATTMLMGEIATCVKYNLPIKLFVSKNNALGLIRWEQMMFLGHAEYGIELQDINFAKVAEACGAVGVRVEDPNQVDAVVKEALDAAGPVVVEGVVDPFEPVMPGHIRPAQAEHYAKALRIGLRSGQPAERRIALNMSRNLHELNPKDFKVLSESLESGVPELFPDAGPSTNAKQEPQASFDIQRESALERRSGHPSASTK
ncbi:thiamine pyrophosphate-dependent enzyme [Granulicella sp. L60]|uniref:thiamine pyrophosphate-dependent enzyme n=1 Tax=Granulicella sp. L60 TaxID=1641866 RepID=UPI00131B2583|nr:thiamine pyrophosphate-dependent enzyme [Granulicella sp. L60]